MHYLAMAINLSVPDMGGKGAGKAEGEESPAFMSFPLRRERRLGDLRISSPMRTEVDRHRVKLSCGEWCLALFEVLIDEAVSHTKC